MNRTGRVERLLFRRPEAAAEPHRENRLLADFSYAG
jgi:hypothetical protein